MGGVYEFVLGGPVNCKRTSVADSITVQITHTRESPIRADIE